ncbi:MAG: diguanylate cyclase [Lachnospiraceae bacterium]|nr:diguanylate cyclase [Lachnospiraceae bacterium]
MGKLQKAVLIRTVVPIMLMGIVIALFASNRYEKMLYEQMKTMLSMTASSVMAVYDELYEGDYVLIGDGQFSLYKGEQELTGDFEIIDRLSAEAGVEITLFYKDARILTTLKDAEGERYVATGVNSVIYRAMERDLQIQYYNVEIDGVEYYACYVPMMHSDGNLIGMIGVARQSDQISEAVLKTLEPIWLIILCCMVLAGYISVNYTKGLVDGIQHIRDFLQRMTRGELNHLMNSRILKREDEIGDAGRSVVAMQKAVRILVERDSLTTLYNRRYGTAKLKKIQSQAARSGLSYAVAMGDIDYFKKVNDTFGHEAGDSVLIRVAEQLKRAVVGKGFACRWGGEEFLIVLEGLDRKEVLETLTQMLQNIRSIAIPCQGQEVRVTMTIGLVDGRLSDDHEELIRMADDRLYYGKEHGRNRIVTNMDEDAGALDMYDMENIREILSQAEYDLSEMSKNLYQFETEDVAEALELQLMDRETEEKDPMELNRMVEEIVRNMAERFFREIEEDGEEKEASEEKKETKEKKTSDSGSGSNV